MPRLVPNQRAAAAAARGQLNAEEEPTPQRRLENYLERVAKYVPVEIIAAFVAIRGLLSPSGIPSGAEFGLYGTLVVLTPAYLGKFGGPVPNKALQLTVATFSFVVWSYGIGGPFFFDALESAVGHKIQYPGLSGAVVVVWSLIVGLVEPKQ